MNLYHSPREVDKLIEASVTLCTLASESLHHRASAPPPAAPLKAPRRQCLRIANVSAPCSACGRREDFIHLPDNGGLFYCAGCCPPCGSNPAQGRPHVHSR